MKNEQQKKTGNYYQIVSEHFDEDARLFEQRYRQNTVLQKIREDFRRLTEQYAFSNALEIGCGPGIDLVYFARKYPGKSFSAIDVSPEMVKRSENNLKKNALTNARVKTGHTGNIYTLFPDRKFDLIYVYFGGLNTVYSLREAALHLSAIAAPGAIFILTSVNRFYLMDFVYKSMKFKFKEGVSRFRNQWKGYSPGRNLPSHVYSTSFIKRTFAPEFQILFRRGYSLFYPPWFGARPLHDIPLLSQGLWKLDGWLQKTPFWNTGEYSIYIMKHRSNS